MNCRSRHHCSGLRRPYGRRACSAGAGREPFPARNIHIIVPNAAGGGIDYFARLVGAKLSDRLGKPVVIENRAGANGNAGGRAGDEGRRPTGTRC